SSSSYSPPTPLLPSFPTRRSSDLGAALAEHEQRAYASCAVASASSTRPLASYACASRCVSMGSRPSSAGAARTAAIARPGWPRRSEEHTSELQSRFDLVCRLLLEK